MSFETWLTTTDIPEHYIGISHVRDAFEAGRAEAEAQIAALKDSHTEVEMQLVALQSERDALRKASRVTLDRAYDVLGVFHQEACEKPEGGQCDCYMCQLERAMEHHEVILATPASGEPARKP